MKKQLWICAWAFVIFCSSMPAQAKLDASKHDAYALYGDKQYKKAYQLWYPQAVKGDSVAQYAIGVMLMYGQGMKPNRPVALKWLHKAAEQRENEAMRQLMWLYSEGEYVVKDEAKARLWAENLEAVGDEEGVKYLASVDSESKDLNVLNRAIERFETFISENPDLYFEQYRLGMAYASRSKFNESDKAKALEWFDLAQKNSPEGFARFPGLGRYFIEGDVDKIKEVEYLRNQALAEKGDAAAQYRVANYLRHEKKDLPAYRVWLDKSAAQGYAEAQYGKGQAHESASNCVSNIYNDKDPNARIKVVYEAAAKDDDEPIDAARVARGPRDAWDDLQCTESEFSKETVMAMGLVELDALSKAESGKALVWYRKAAAQKKSAALYKLYEYWRGGRTNQIDKETALDALHQSAELGDISAPDELAEMYFKGEGGVQKNLKKALRWYEKSAEYGIHAGVNLHVAQFYCKGNMGVPQDDDLCRHHLLLAQESLGDDVGYDAKALGLMPYVRKFLKLSKKATQ